MIRFEDVTITYPDAAAPAIAGVDLEIAEGELCVVVGRTGSGKSTLLAAVNGLVPHFTGGLLAGRVTVDGRDTRSHPPRELADVVGMVGQDPVAGFVTDSVEEELAYAMESIGLAPAVMRRRVEETLDLLGLADLRDRALATLSGGQQQRVAIGAALTAHPRVLVLDEPTSALDPGAAEEVLAALHRLVHDLGITVLIAEHRLERVAQFADRVVWLPGYGRPPVAGAVAEVLARSPVAPPVVRLGQLVGWDPPPVSVREARRRATPLRTLLTDRDHPLRHTPAYAASEGSEPRHTPAYAASDGPETRHTPAYGGEGACGRGERARGRGEGARGSGLGARGVVVRYPGRVAVRGVDLRVTAGERVAVMGRNGSGKSSLLWALQGTGPRHGGEVRVDGDDPAALKPNLRRQRVGLVPQQPTDLLYRESVQAECAQADVETGAAPGSTRALLDRVVPGIDGDAHPRDLSEGQRLAVALAVTLAAAPSVLLLDEPTRGLDYPAKTALAIVLRERAEAGTAVLLATHDVEFVAEYAGRVVLLADGEVIADGPVSEVVTSSPVFAPQVAKVLAPQRWLTVAEVQRALAT